MNYINEAMNRAGVGMKISINVVRELCEMLGNAECYRDSELYKPGYCVTYIVVRVGLHGGKRFRSTKAAAEYLSASLESFDKLKITG